MDKKQAEEGDDDDEVFEGGAADAAEHELKVKRM